MKNVLKVGALALALGFFATSCNSGNNGAANSDSTTEMSAPSDQQIAPDSSAMAPDTSAAPVDTTNQ